MVTVDALLTNDSTPELTGTVNDPVAIIEVTVGGNIYNAVNNSDGTWTLLDDTIIPDLADGTYDIKVTATDLAGNIKTDATTNELIIDTIAPVVTVYPLFSNDSTVELTGTVDDPDAAIKVTVSNNTYNAINNGDGTWTLPYGTITPSLADGTYDIEVTATDLAGNLGTDTTIDELTIYTPLKGRVTDGDGQGLPYVAVTLNQDVLLNPTPWFRYNLTIYTDENGYFMFPVTDNEGDTIPAGEENCTLRVDLKYRPNDVTFDLFEVLYDIQSVYIQKGKFDPGLLRNHDFDFGNVASLSRNPSIADNLYDDLALIYYNEAEWWRFVRTDLNYTPTLDHPLRIHAFSIDADQQGADYYSPSSLPWLSGEVYLTTAMSTSTSNSDLPRKTQWHEAFHYLMENTHGADPFLQIFQGVVNHGGWTLNADNSTADAWIEGWAEFWPLAVADWLGEADPEIYFDTLNLETNYGPWDPKSEWNKNLVLRADRNGDGIADFDLLEELAVASLLWDLIDANQEVAPSGPGRDKINITTDRLWLAIGNEDGSNQIINVADLYERLRNDGIGQGVEGGYTELERLFVLHKIFRDTQNPGDNGYHQYDDAEQGGIGFIADAQHAARRSPYLAIPNHHLAFSVLTHEGEQLENGVVKVYFDYEIPCTSNSWSKEFYISELNGGLFLAPTPSEYEVTIRIQVQDADGNSSEEFVLPMDEYVAALGQSAGAMYSVVHQFVIDGTQPTSVRAVFADPLLADPEWFSAYIELLPGEQPENIDLSRVKILYANGVKLANSIAAASDPALPFVQNRQTTDHDGDGVLELLVRFPWAAVLAAVSTTESGPVSVTIGWTDSTGNQNEGTAFMNGTPGLDDINLSSDTIYENDVVTIVGNFNDPNLLDTHQLVIDWGDGTIETTTLAVGIRDFSTNHQYLDDEPTGTLLDDYTISVTVSDNSGSDTFTTTVTVKNVVPTIELDPVLAINEGGIATLTGTITDPGTLDTFTLDINWGDPLSPNNIEQYTYGVSATQSQTFILTHQYLDDNPSSTPQDDYIIQVTLTDDDGGVGTDNLIITIKNVAPTIIGLSLIPEIEENGIVTLAGKFSDPGILDSHMVVIDWADGTSKTLILAVGERSFLATHQYLDDDPGGTPQDDYVIQVTLTDDDGGVGTDNLIITVKNVAPTIIDLSLTPEIDENGIVTLAGKFSDPGILDSHIIVIDWADGTSKTLILAVGERSFLATHQYLDDDPGGTPQDDYVIQVTIIDDDAGYNSISVTTTVKNIAPQILALSNNSLVVGDTAEGEEVIFTAQFTDIGTLDSHTAIIDWGDGTSSSTQIVESGGSGSVSGSHVYADGGIYNIELTLMDDDTGVDTGITTAVITGIRLDNGVLQIIGTKQNDHITVNLTGWCHSQKQFKVHANFLPPHGYKSKFFGHWRGHKTFDATGINKIIVLVGDGNDKVTIAGNIKITSLIDGGAGNDMLKGGGGADILLGAEGKDTLIGGSGRDLLFGGDGPDWIVGNSGEDILVGGTTVFDIDDSNLGQAQVILGQGFDEALMALLAEWNSERDYETRVNNLKDGSGSNDRLNGSYFLQKGVTVFNDGIRDHMNGSSGKDWLISFDNYKDHWWRW